MEEPHTKLTSVLKDLQADRAMSAGSTMPYRFFWDWLKPKAKTLPEVFSNELSRKKLYEHLQSVVDNPEHKFSDWLPPKVRLSFLASFERDTRLCHRSRIDAFKVGSINHGYRAKQIEDTVNAIKATTEGGTNSSPT